MANGPVPKWQTVLYLNSKRSCT